MNNFQYYLRNNTNLREGTIRLYVRTMNSFSSKHSEMSQENINRFVAESFRLSNSFYVKYAVKHYLNFIKKPKLYKGLVKVKLKPRKKMGKYHPDRLLRQLIQNIEKDKYRDIAALQYATGARAREIITLKAENIDFEYATDAIRVRLERKGGKEGITFLSMDFKPILEKYLQDGKAYLFMDKAAQYADDDRMDIMINTQRSYYYTALNRSAASMGLKGFGTHDFRRNVADQLRRKHKDLFLVKKVLGHSRMETTLKYFSETEEDVQDAIIGHQKRSA